MVPNDSVSSFEVTDLDNNGVKDLVYVTTAGELKYAKQKGGNAKPVPGDLIEITKESAEKYLLNSIWEGPGRSTYTIVTTSEGDASITIKNGYDTSWNACKYNVFASGLHFSCRNLHMTQLTGNTVMINGTLYFRK